MKHKLQLAFVLIAVVAVSLGLPVQEARAAATINVVNQDGAGEGFNDPTAFTPVGGNRAFTLGAARLNAFRYAAELWGACLNSNVTIQIDAQMDPQFCNATSAVLGSAGALTVHRDFAGAPVAGTWYSQALANSLAGVDLSTSADINATFNSNINGNPACLGGASWYYGFDGNPPPGDIDFVTVVLHEIGHGLGFQTFVSLGTGAKFLGFNDTYMLNLERHFGAPADYPSMTDAQRVAASISDPNLHWTGPSVDAQGPVSLTSGMSNGHVRMHGPNPAQSGSSVSHFSTALFPSELMEPSYTGPNHDVSMALNLMQDIGWSLENKTQDVCDGSLLDLASPSGPAPNTATGAVNSNQERGVYVTALKDYNLCAIAMEVDHVLGQTVTARVYAANGNTRGALLASGTATATFSGQQLLYIPINASLQACQDYDITVDLGDIVSWPWWSEGAITEPYDVDGVIRVRDGHRDGAAGNSALAHFALRGSAASPNISALEPGGVFTTYSDGSEARGAYIRAARTISVCSVGFEFDNPFGGTFPMVARANIYNATGTTRGSLLATGTLDVTASGLQFHDVPVSAVLLEGNDYDVEVEFVNTTWGGISEGGAPSEFTIDDAIIVVNGEQGGNAGNTILPHMRIGWEPTPGDAPLDLVGPFHGPADVMSTQPNFDYGMYVRAVQNSELVTVGWMADVPAGQVIGANVYEATGTTRGALISSGTILSSTDGMRWHDIPVSASLSAGQNYDLEIDITGVNSWPWWNDGGTPGKPYIAYGLLEMLDSEQGGSASNVALPQIRVRLCTSVVTGIADGPSRAPNFTMAAPYPNPISGNSARIAFSLDRAAPLSVTIYDVAGRRVATVKQNQRFPAGPGFIDLDAAGLASGVYFVQMKTPTQSMSRKITVIR